MAEQRGIAGVQTAELVDIDLRSRGADYTPRGLARACVEATIRLGCHSAGWSTPGRDVDHAVLASDAYPDLFRAVSDDRPFRVLDVCAGAGVYASELRRHWVHRLGLPSQWLHITAVEIHRAELEHLERWADDVILGDYREALVEDCPDCGGTGVAPHGDSLAPCLHCESTGGVRRLYDLALGNPDFQLLRAETLRRPSAGRRGIYDVETSMVARLLDVAPVVGLLHTQQAWTKDGPGLAVRRAYRPIAEYDVPGAIRFRARGTRSPKTGKPYGTDQRSYTWSIWHANYVGEETRSRLLPMAHDGLSWAGKDRPGTERDPGLAEVRR